MKCFSFFKFSGLFCLLLAGNIVFSQGDTSLLKKLVIPVNRQLAHDNIDKEQLNLLKYDGTADRAISISSDDEVNYRLTQSATTQIDWLQYHIEKDTLLNHNKRLYYLRGLQTLLKNLQTGWQKKQFNPARLSPVIDAYAHCLELDKKDMSIEAYINELDYEVAAPVVWSAGFESNSGIKNARDLLVLKYCLLYPAETFITLRDNPDTRYADTLVKLVAKKYPVQLYSFAQAGNKLGAAIRNIQDDVFVQAITSMSRSKSGQQYFPFLDNILKGKISISQIDSLKDDSLQYYRLLVNTQMDYTRRMINGDTAYQFASLTERLAIKAKDVFVNTINGLHEESDAVRFRSLQTLTAQELYYLAVLTDGLIYTSSYTKGVYPLIMKKINNRGDSLLLSLHFDHYRKFISQAAAFNTLSNFLGTFPGDDATTLMRAFAGHLEKTAGLEDGVDVADSYASITENNKPLAAEMLQLIHENQQRTLRDNNKRGISIYTILSKLFLSADSANNIDLTKELGIPPVYNVPLASLVNDRNEVIIQMFFYGDEDGKTDYNIFLGMYNNANWKIDKINKQWTVVRSAKGNPVSIYANIPFDEETGEDDNAQKALGDYFETNHLKPTITINRGHSYHALTTIAYMAPTSRIVFMGSCGGFNLIDAILKKSSDAHIISSKQIGKRDINRPFLLLLTEKLRNGANVDWIPFWKEFRNNAKVEGFEDYIPPYKNLGRFSLKRIKKSVKNIS